MDVLWAREENLSDYGKESRCRVFSAFVRITDLPSFVEEAISLISNTSWLDDMGVVQKAALEACSKPTVKKLTSNIFNRIEDKTTSECGEYVVSISASRILGINFEHKPFPLADLIKPRISGNEGFDFHSESTENYINFGEAKYRSSGNPYKDALEQIADLVDKQKDIAELIVLELFASDKAQQNAINGCKAYTAAFSINSDDPEKIIKAAISSTHIDKLLDHCQIYILGIKTNDS